MDMLVTIHEVRGAPDRLFEAIELSGNLPCQVHGAELTKHACGNQSAELVSRLGDGAFGQIEMKPDVHRVQMAQRRCGRRPAWATHLAG